jgi:hypothetical protein
MCTRKIAEWVKEMAEPEYYVTIRKYRITVYVIFIKNS